MKVLLKIILITMTLTSSIYGMGFGEGCSRYTGSYNNEKICIKNRVPAQKSYACGKYTGTHDNETLCLKNHKNLTVSDIYQCTKYTSTNSAEGDCLFPDRGWFD